MAIILNDNIQANLGKPVDNKYLQPTLNRPYTGVSEVNSTIIEALRYSGLTVNINNVEYWYATGTGDGDLVVKADSSATNVTGATNGLSLINQNVELGGTLTGDTTIDTTGSFTLTFEGQDVEYAADYSSSFTERSIPDTAYVTGLTSSKLDISDFDTYSGLTDTRISDNEDDIAYLSGQTDLKLNISDFDTYSGLTDTRISDNEDDIAFITANTINTASNGLTKTGTDVELGGTLDQATTINGAGNNFTISNVSDLTLGDNANMELSVTGGSAILDINAKSNAQLVLKSQTGTTAGDDFTNAIGINLDFNGDAFTIVDNRATAKGIEYLSDYSLNFSDRSLVDKAYVDAVATGLDVKNSSNVATTANIDLTGGTFSAGSTIDGVVVQDGWRVLVKNQTIGSENGIYDYVETSSGFIRSSDFDGNPAGEVTQGSFTFVITGNTQANTAWIVITPDPITIDVTDIDFTVFSQPFDLVDGTGTTINIIGSNRQISVELAPNSGLDFDAASASGRLRLASSVAGQGVSLTSGVLDLNITDAASVGSAINVKSDTGGADTLFIDSNDINSNISAANGLTNSSGTLVLGGTLTGNTTIDSTGSFTLTFEGQDVEYAADYSSSFTPRSIVDQGYVTGLTSIIDGDIATVSAATVTNADDIQLVSGVTTTNAGNIAFITANTINTASNGLTKVGTNAVLGGILTGNTTIDTAGFGVVIGQNAYATGFYSFAMGSNTNANGNYSFVIGQSSTADGGEAVAMAGGFAYGNKSFAGGYQTSSNGYGSLAFGTNVITNGDRSQSFGYRTISCGNYSHTSGRGIYANSEVYNVMSSGIAAFNHSENTSGQTIGHGALANNSAILGGLNHNIASGNTRAAIIGGNTIKLTGTTYIDHTAVSNFAIMSTPSAGTTNDSVLVRDSSNGIIKAVAGSELGDANNIYDITGVTSATLSANDYVILVDTSTTGETITLPSAPVNGQAYKIKDSSGNALTFPIIIDANGNTIDGSSTVTINTDYGALEIVYSSSASGWFTLSFIN